MQLGFLMRTPRGRVCTPAAWQHMGRVMPAQAGVVNQTDGQLKMDL